MRIKSAHIKSETAALLSNQPKHSNRVTRNNSFQRQRPYCHHCKQQGHFESRFWSKYPDLDPVHRNTSSANPALIANQSDEDPFIFLMAKYENSSEPKHTGKCFVDSGCSNHMTSNKSLFSSYTSGHPPSVEFGNSASVKIAGIGIMVVSILVHGRKVRCMLKNVLHVPGLGYQLLSIPTFDQQ